MTEKMLPPAFADLGPWTDKWCIDTQAARLNERVASSMTDLETFYEALLPRMEEIIDYLNTLDTVKPGDMSAEDRSLFRLCQSFFETSLSVELLFGPDVPGIFPPHRVTVDVDG